MASPARIFLSHKTVDKTIVRDYKTTLEIVGLQSWLDEDEFHAGVELHRALQKGMKDSCAAVFFITPAYQDDKFLRAEINYAIAEKTQRGDDFAIITLVLSGADGKAGVVPDILEPYVWKQPSTDLQGLRENLHALPLPFRDIRPSAEVSATPDVRVSVNAGQLVSMRGVGRANDTEDIVMVNSRTMATGQSSLGAVYPSSETIATRSSGWGRTPRDRTCTSERLSLVMDLQYRFPPRVLMSTDRILLGFFSRTRSADDSGPTRRALGRPFMKRRVQPNMVLSRTINGSRFASSVARR